MFTQSSSKFAPDRPIKKQAINNAGDGSMPDPETHQEEFLLQTEIYQPNTGVKTWISIITL